MSNRVQISDDMLEAIAGGNVTYKWDGQNGICGVSGNYQYSFTDKSAFLSFAIDCIKNKGMTDVETINALLSAGIISQM